MYTVYAGPFHIPKYNPMKQILDFFFFFLFKYKQESIIHIRANFSRFYNTVGRITSYVFNISD